MNLPWFVSPTEAVDPHQLGGSESLGFRILSCLFHRRHGLFLRTRRARLYRMGTRRRRLTHRRFRAFLLSTRRYSGSVHGRAIRVSPRRMMSVTHVHVLRIRSRRINSFVHGCELTSGFRRIHRLIHGSSFLLPNFRRCSAACRKEVSTIAVVSVSMIASNRSYWRSLSRHNKCGSLRT